MLLPGVLLVVPIVLLVAAIALLFAGSRGRRVDDHPLCRRCGFDLVGLPPGGAVCSECGASLADERAIRRGHRVRRAGMIALSLALLLPSMLWLGVVGYATATDVNWMTYKPVWWLLRDAETDPAAMAELLARQGNRKLTVGEINAVVAKALGMQVNRATPWNAGWGEFIEQARIDGHVPEAEWARYAQQAVVVTMRARPIVARGDPIWVEASLRELRIGRTWKPDALGTETSRRLDGVECGSAAVGGFVFRSRERGPQASGSLLRPDDKLLARMTPGTKTLTVAYDVELTAFHGQRTPPANVQLDVKFELRDPPPPTVEIERNAAAWNQIQQSAGVTNATYFPSGDLSLRLQLAAPPSFDLAYDVFARLPDGRERKLSSYQVVRGGRVPVECTGDVGQLSPDVKTIDVVLRPSRLVALQTLTITRLCAGEVRVEAVPLRRPGEAPIDARNVEDELRIPVLP